MTSASSSDLLKNLFNALPDSATGGDLGNAYYVNRTENAPDTDPVKNLLRFIDWSPACNESYLFSGLRGAGKTTELNRLVAELRQQGIAAYYCDVSTYLNLHDPKLSLPELLMAALAGLSDAVRRELGHDSLSDSIWQRTKRLFSSDVQLKPSITVGAVKVEATLQENPDFRKALNTAAQSSNSFYEQAAAFADEVASLIKTKTNCQKIVLVVDSLERLSAPSGEEKELFNSLKQVFFIDPQRLRFSSLAVVYSAPPYLHAVLPNVNSGFSQCVSLPNFKVMQRPQPETPPERHNHGIDQMLTILERRFPDWRKVLSEAVLKELAWLSGGNVRRYFRLVRGVALKAALSQVALPIDDVQADPVTHAISDERQPLQWLNAEDRRWLQFYRSDSQSAAAHINDLNKDLPSIIRLFDHSLVLDYRNGEVWYQVPPLVHSLLA
ncbi:MAG: hypothetical protein RLZZ612_1659 [Pseudomonadota bacterium]|jgi:hypothetical protein